MARIEIMPWPHLPFARQRRLKYAAEDLLTGRGTLGAYQSAQGRFAAWTPDKHWPEGKEAYRAYKREIGEAGYGNRTMRKHAERKQAHINTVG